jgi:hypothetical protein
VRLNRELVAKGLSLKDVSEEDAAKIYGVDPRAFNGFNLCGERNAVSCDKTQCRNHADYTAPPEATPKAKKVPT